MANRDDNRLETTLYRVGSAQQRAPAPARLANELCVVATTLEGATFLAQALDCCVRQAINVVQGFADSHSRDP